MKNANKIKMACYISLGVAVISTTYSCKKSADAINATNTQTSSTTTTGNLLVAAANTTTVASVGATATTATTRDSVYLMHACPPGPMPDTVAAAALPSATTAYLTANYAGYTFQKAFKLINKSGTVDGYVVSIIFNGKPVGLKFDATGAFVQVLEQRERPDLNGPGWHQGGRFDNRNGMHQDTITISALPAAIKSYFSSNYPTDTLLHAVVTQDTTYIVISANKGLYATSFSSKLVFVKRLQLNPRPDKHVPILQSALPAAITTYLTATYSGYVFDKAFAEKENGAITKYFVFIDASGTRYAVQFDGAGAFVKSVTLK